MKYILFLLLVSGPAAFAFSPFESTAFVREDKGPYVQLECTINTTPGSCALDSGSSVSWVADIPPFAQLPVLPSLEIANSGGRAVYPTGQVGAFRIGHGEATETLRVVRSNAYWGLPQTIGVIGADLLVKRDLIFDFAKVFAPNEASLIFGRLESSPLPLGFHSVKGRRIPGEKIVIEVQLGGETVRALWDTHAKSAISQKFLERHAELFTQAFPVKTVNLEGKVTAWRAYETSAPLTIGGQELRVGALRSLGAQVATENGVDLVLGMDVISEYSWAFEAQKTVFYLFRADESR